MKATINGIEVEGTPQEIMEFNRISETVVPYQITPTGIIPTPTVATTSTSGSVTVTGPTVTSWN